MLLVLTAILFDIIGIVLVAGGGWLVALGGSPYYLVAGLFFLATGIFLFLKRPVAIWIYAALILGSLAWAVWEVGFDWWQLGPRGGIIVLLGLWLMLPAIRRPLGFSSPTGQIYPATWLPRMSRTSRVIA